MRVHLTLWLVLLIGAFSWGSFRVLQNRDLQAQLQNPKRQIDALKLQLQMSELRDAASMMLLELSRQNFGFARDYSSQFLQQIKGCDRCGPGPGTQEITRGPCRTRENLTAQLATANTGALATSQPIVLKTFEVTRSVK